MDIPRAFIFIGAIALSVILHEIAHAYSAYKLGDPTGKIDGRVSLNPINHIDPLFTILVPMLFFIASGGRFVFGGAKPVRINPANFKNPGLGMMITSACGPITNILLAGSAFGMLIMLNKLLPSMVHPLSYNALFFGVMIYLNIILAILNLIPIPPLDGSRILRFCLPAPFKSLLDRLEHVGIFLIVAFLFFVFGRILEPVIFFLRDMMFETLGYRYTIELLENMGF
jgi:Zn-dependent protease